MSHPTLRQATPEDLRFVHSSWHTSHWKTWAHRHIEREVYNVGQDRRIDLAIARSEVLVAFFPEVPDEVLGWACIESYPEVLHYVYVKGAYRRTGIGTGLVKNRARTYTHYTDAAGRKFASSLSLEFNPYKEHT